MDADVGCISPVEVDQEEYSRRKFLKTAAWATAAISATGIIGFGVAERSADAQPTLAAGVKSSVDFPTYQGLGDAAILQFAYQLELLEGTFYKLGVQAGILTPFATTQIAAIRDHEFAHADAIAGILRRLGASIPQPSFTYPNVFGDQGSFLELASTLEPVGIGAYQGSGPALQDKSILAAAGSILGTECDHRTAIDILRGISPPNNRAFQRSFTFGEAAASGTPFGIKV